MAGCTTCGVSIPPGTNVVYFFPNPGVIVDCCPCCGLHKNSRDALLLDQQREGDRHLRHQNDLWRATEGRLGVMP